MLDTIDAWVDYIQSLHVREIDLSLERVKDVYLRLRPHGFDFKVITVAGTNGKGSTCELLAAIYHEAGYCVGKYTSPHIELFNERFSVDRKYVTDQELLDTFERVERARQSTRLTYFEFGTLLAIELFASKPVDVAILEVGLGGRLDAVNIFDPDIAVITSISIDHTDWLGSTITEIASEKIAISRPNIPCVIGIEQPPKIMMEYCQQHKVPTYIAGLDFNFDLHSSRQKWNWLANNKTYKELPLPFSQTGVQLENAAATLQVIELLQNVLSVSDEAIYQGLSQASLPARCQIISKSPLIVVDVAHNQASVSRLAEFVDEFDIRGKVYALCGMLKDKQIEQSLACLIDVVDEWCFVDIDNPRGSEAVLLSSILHSQTNLMNIAGNDQERSKTKSAVSFCYTNVASAYTSLSERLNNDDGLIVFGSFFVVSDIMRILKV